MKKEKENYAVLIKPLSFNDAYNGRKTKTALYHAYSDLLMYKLPRIELDPAQDYKIHFEFGLSSAAGDYDNPIKATQDIICKKYGIDDKMIWTGVIDKYLTHKGEEFITFSFEEMTPEEVAKRRNRDRYKAGA